MISVYNNGDVSLRTVASTDKWGKITWNSPVVIAASIVRKTKWIRKENGEEVISTIQIYVDPSISITHEDRLTFDSFEHEILRINKPFSFLHQEYTEVLLS